MSPDLEAAMTPKPPQTQPQGNPAPNTPPQSAQAPTATDILGKLTDNDSSKMQALLASLKDQDKRSAFAQALGVIGDTFGNMGMAKAGQRPEGFTTPQMIAGMNQQSKQAQIENLTQSLAADPNSQTSKMAQQTLMQSMGIKPGDPRAARIMAMPAQAITQMLPQMTDAVKNNIEKEKNLIEAKRADLEAQNQAAMRQNQAAELVRQNQLAQANIAGGAVKELSPLNPTNWPILGAAKQNLQNVLGGNQTQQAQPMTATNKMGHKIISHDGGRSWQPL